MPFKTRDKESIALEHTVECRVGELFKVHNSCVHAVILTDNRHKGRQNSVNNAIFWDVTPCGSCKNRLFAGT
jgi:hypothetical protein